MTAVSVLSVAFVSPQTAIANLEMALLDGYPSATLT